MKIITLENKLLKSNISRTYDLGYLWAATPLLDEYQFTCEFLQRAPLVLVHVQES